MSEEGIMSSPDELKAEVRDELNQIMYTYTKSLDEAINIANADAMDSFDAVVQEYGYDLVRKAAEEVDEVKRREPIIITSIWQLV